MNQLTSEFEAKTGNVAMYRKGSSDYHTLRYVNWLEAKVEKLTANNSERDVICSDSMCDYCTKIETCNGFEDAGDCFNGRKLTPVL